MIEPMRRTYFAAYDRRRRASAAGLTFSRPDTSALAALAYVRGAHALAEREEPVTCLRDITRELAASADHSAAADITGLAWMDGYGSVPMSDPPSEQIVWAFRH